MSKCGVGLGFHAKQSMSFSLTKPLAAGSLHPAVPNGVRQRMIAFLQMLHAAANQTYTFGGVGRPWEFNLRDLLRWCQLVKTATGTNLPG